MKEFDMILADTPGFGRVRLCECNVVHLSIGPVTITLALEAFRQTANLVSIASQQMANLAASQSFDEDGEATLNLPTSRLTH